MTATLRPVDRGSVTVDDAFWTPRLTTNTAVTLDHQYDRLKESHRLRNFAHAARGEGEFVGRYYNDSDVYKWLEASCHALSRSDDAALRERVDHVVDLIEAAQQPDGYLNTYFTLEVDEELRWTNSALHELYNAGHLFEAAVAHRGATGETRLVEVARRLADHIDEVFGPDAKLGIPGHEEIELALVKLYRETDEQRYLDLASFFVENRGREDSPLRWELEHLDKIATAMYNPDGTDSRELYRNHMLGEDGTYSGTYMQDHRPIREQESVVGHAVRATYFYSGVADVAMERDDSALVETLEELWTNMATRRMYVTGALGSTYENEGFTEDFDLPTDTAYAETCAAVGNVFWNHRMLQLTGAAKYADIMELALYNAVLSGVALDGERFRYTNPHESDGRSHPHRDIDPGPYDQERFSLEYKAWFRTACCPPNAARLLAGLHRHIYHRRDDRIALSLYIGSTLETTIDGTPVTITQETDCPWDGDVTVDIALNEPTTFELAFRQPDWAPGVEIAVDGTAVEYDVEDGYAVLKRQWTDGDIVELSVAMPVRQVEGHPRIRDATDRVAVSRGPLVYCLDEADNGKDLHRYRIPVDGAFTPTHEPDILEGVTVLEGTARQPSEDEWEDDLYRERTTRSTDPTKVRMIPFYDWGERDAGEMRVWVPTTDR